MYCDQDGVVKFRRIYCPILFADLNRVRKREHAPFDTPFFLAFSGVCLFHADSAGSSAWSNKFVHGSKMIERGPYVESGKTTALRGMEQPSDPKLWAGVGFHVYMQVQWTQKAPLNF